MNKTAETRNGKMVFQSKRAVPPADAGQRIHMVIGSQDYDRLQVLKVKTGVPVYRLIAMMVNFALDNMEVAE